MKIPTEIYQRVVGYYQTRSTTNPGKLEEIRERKLFDGNKCLLNICDKKKCE